MPLLAALVAAAAAQILMGEEILHPRAITWLFQDPALASVWLDIHAFRLRPELTLPLAAGGLWEPAVSVVDSRVGAVALLGLAHRLLADWAWIGSDGQLIGLWLVAMLALNTYGLFRLALALAPSSQPGAALAMLAAATVAAGPGHLLVAQDPRWVALWPAIVTAARALETSRGRRPPPPLWGQALVLAFACWSFWPVAALTLAMQLRMAIQVASSWLRRMATLLGLGAVTVASILAMGVWPEPLAGLDPLGPSLLPTVALLRAVFSIAGAPEPVPWIALCSAAAVALIWLRAGPGHWWGRGPVAGLPAQRRRRVVLALATLAGMALTMPLSLLGSRALTGAALLAMPGLLAMAAMLRLQPMRPRPRVAGLCVVALMVATAGSVLQAKAPPRARGDAAARVLADHGLGATLAGADRLAVADPDVAFLTRPEVAAMVFWFHRPHTAQAMVAPSATAQAMVAPSALGPGAPGLLIVPRAALAPQPSACRPVASVALCAVPGDTLPRP